MAGNAAQERIALGQRHSLGGKAQLRQLLIGESKRASGAREVGHCSTVTIQVPSRTTASTTNATTALRLISASVELRVMVMVPGSSRSGNRSRARGKDRAGADRRRIAAVAVPPASHRGPDNPAET